MPTMLCDQGVFCPGSDLPIANFSAESPDNILFDSIAFYYTPPRLNGTWNAVGCVSLCESSISQDDANQCATRQAVQCVNTQTGSPTFPPPTIVCNTPQVGFATCPDGNIFSWTVPAGLFCGESQTQVNIQAQQYATRQAAINKICLGPLQRCCCVKQTYSSRISIQSILPVVLTVISGSMPPGLSMDATGFVTGTPTLSGTYTFVVQAQAANNSFMRKSFTVTVLTIFTTALPNFTIGTLYNYQLLAGGGSGVYNWKITSGSLPAGLTMSLTGLISGTPTASGTNPLTFSVIDTNCEAADHSFFPPRVAITTASTTQIATVFGFPEYPGFVSSPPKRYHTLSWTGTSEQQLWFPANTLGNSGPAYQIAGARFDYSGSSTIDGQGNYTSLYAKNLSQMCNATGPLVTCLLPAVNGGFENYVFAGWLGPTGHQKCPPPGIPYAFVNNQAIGKGDSALDDISFFWGSSKPNPLLSNAQVSRFAAVSSTSAQSIDSGSDFTSGGPATFIALFEPVPQGVIPQIDNTTQGTIWFFALVVWNHNYLANLSNEYTDAEALSNAQVILGNGSTAQNFARTTGFTSTFTNVVFTLSMSDLLVGITYTLSVDFFDSTTGIVTTRQYGIIANKSTQSLVDTIPTPIAGHTITVRNPRIVFNE